MIKKLLILVLCLFPLVVHATKMTDFTEDTSPTSDDIFWTTNAPGTSPADRKVTLGNLLLWMATQDWTTTGTWDFSGDIEISKVNAAGGSADALTLSGTLGIMDGADDIFRGIYLNYTNSNHTAGNVFAINIAGITGDADATESAIYIQEGWDSGILSYSPVHLKGPSDVGKLFLFDTGEADYIAIVPPADVTTTYTMTLPATEPTGLLRADAGVMSTTDNISGVTVNGGTASTVAAWDGSQNLTSLSSQNVVTTGQIDGKVKVMVITGTTTIDASASNQAVYYINGADSARTLNLPAAAAGLAYCFANALYAKALTIHPASGDYVILAGENNDSSDVVSSGANTDKICVLGIDTTYWLVTASTGTWAND